MKKSLSIRLAMEIPERQRDILAMIADGITTQGIGLALKLSPKTVEYHRRLLMLRTGLYDYANLTKLAMRLGLTAIDV